MRMVLALYDPFQRCGEAKWKEGVDSTQFDSIESFLAAPADLFLYWGTTNQLFQHREQVEQLAKPLLIASVVVTLAELGWTQHPQRARFNGWPGMRNGQIWEWSGAPALLDLFQETLGIQGISVPDQIGLLAPRVVAMIINEACYALAAGVSTASEINTAMRLGTNYPYGPFEWAERIGWEEVYAVLNALALTDAKYTPHPLIQSYLNN